MATDLFPILVVDDEPTIGYFLRSAAKSNFVEAVFTQLFSVPEAQDYILTLDGEEPRLIILDIDQKSDPSGFNFLIFLKAHPIARMILVIILSKIPLPSDLMLAYNLRAAWFVSKPVELAGWNEYVKFMRRYWFDSSTTPRFRFTKGQ